MAETKDWAQAQIDGADIHAAADQEWAKVNKVYPPKHWHEMVFGADNSAA
jgi:hypothetical protein